MFGKCFETFSFVQKYALQAEFRVFSPFTVGFLNHAVSGPRYLHIWAKHDCELLTILSRSFLKRVMYFGEELKKI